MDIFEAIEARRSIRKFKSDTIPREVLEKILRAATLAPSGKNKQPWKFDVVRGEKRDVMVVEMKKGIERLQKMGIKTSSVRFTLEVMQHAPVTIFVFNPFSKHPMLKRDTLEVYADLVDIQSVGAAIQNMLLAVHGLGLGTLWICDVFFAYEELCAWLDETGEMIAAVSMGYPEQSPEARPRKSVAEVTKYVD